MGRGTGRVRLRCEGGWLDFAVDVFEPGVFAGLELALLKVRVDVLNDEAQRILEDVDLDVSRRREKAGIGDASGVNAQGAALFVSLDRNTSKNVHGR